MAVSAKVATAYVDLVARTSEFEKALGDARGQARRFSAGMREEMHEARGGIMLLGEEIGVHIPRHLQAVIAKLPGVASAMNAAFNTIAVVAAAEVIIETGKKIYEWAEKNEEAARKTAAAWRGVEAPLRSTNDELRLTNDKLQDSIAKLEHKPGSNGIKTAIDEAIVSADKLGAKLDADLDKIASTLKSQEIGIVGQITGKAGSADVTEHAQDLQIELAKIETEEYKRLATLRSQNATQKEINDLTGAYNAKRHEAIDKEKGWQETQLTTAKTMQSFMDKLNPVQRFAVRAHLGVLGGADETDRVRSLTGFGAALGRTGEFVDLSQDNDKLNQRKTLDEKENQAAQESLKRMEDDIAKRKANHKISVGGEYLFWQERIATFSENSEQYTQVLEKENEAESRFYAGLHGGALENVRKQVKTELTAAPPLLSRPGSSLDAEEKLAAAYDKQREETARLNSEWTISQDRVAVLTGRMTEHEAAIDTARLHAEGYTAQLTLLHEQIDRINGQQGIADSLGFGAENAAKRVQVQTQIDAIDFKAKLQGVTDAQGIIATTWRGMVDSVFDEIIARGNATQEQLRQITARTVDGLNTEFAKAITGGHANFEGVFRGGAESLAKVGFERVEGGLLSALHLGGAGKMGTKGNPQHVLVENFDKLFPATGPNVIGPGGGSSLTGGISRGLLGFLNNSNFFSKLGGGNLFGAGGFFGGGHALGGSVAAGVPIDVGELGRERFVPAVPGHIIPNSEVGRGGVVMHIDARGTDPALTRENFARALQQTHATSVQDASRAMAEAARRRPQG